MGYYIETDGIEGKAEWILKHCPGARFDDDLKTIPPGFVPVIVLDNIAFQAAGIAYDARELAEFTDPEDARTKEYLLVPRAEVIKQCPQVEDRLAWT